MALRGYVGFPTSVPDPDLIRRLQGSPMISPATPRWQSNRGLLGHPVPAKKRIPWREILTRPLVMVSRRGSILPVVVTILLATVLIATLGAWDEPTDSAVSDSDPSRFSDYLPRASRFDLYRWVMDRFGMDEDDPDDDDDDGGGEILGWRGPPVGREQLGVVPDVNLGSFGKDGQTKHTKRADGRALVVEGKKHPIPTLMKRAKKRWVKLKAKQSKTFADAVAEYKKRYGRSPPKGFDKWYAFAKANNVQMIDEFDLIERDLHAFRAFSPASIRARTAFLEEKFEFTWGIRIRGGKATSEGELAQHARAFGVLELISRFAHHLPDMVMWYNGHDNARIMIPWEERERLEGLVKSGRYDDDNDPNFEVKAKGPFPHWGMPQLCPPHSALRAPDFQFGEASRSATGVEMPETPQGAVGTVIASFKRSLDVCNNPQYRHFHTCTSYVFPHFPTGLLPLFTPGVHGNFGDIHAIITEQFDLEDLNDPTWEERPFDRLVWRGQTSGPYWDKGSAWINSQRSRLHLLSHQESGFRSVTIAEPGTEIVRAVKIPNYRLNPLFLDTGMVAPAVQCNQADGTCDQMAKTFSGYEMRLSFDRSNLYKYVFDIDGNSWSGRFRRLLLSNAAVLKATVFPEFWTDWAIPWLHFIPVQIDYSDLWDVMAFFRGGLHGEGAHDALAKEISIAGKDWAEGHMRYSDMEAYQYRLCLEWGRLWSDDRASRDFLGDGVGPEPVWP